MAIGDTMDRARRRAFEAALSALCEEHGVDITNSTTHTDMRGARPIKANFVVMLEYSQYPDKEE